jgi:hypothetical protein
MCRSEDYMTACTRTAEIRIRVEYIEMPRLTLKIAQIRRLCGLPEPLCQEAVHALIATGFLRRTNDGSYIRDGSEA